MEGKAYGGFVITNQQGQTLTGTGGYDASGAFWKREADSLTINPSPAIVHDLTQKGLWDKTFTAEYVKQNKNTEFEKTI